MMGEHIKDNSKGIRKFYSKIILIIIGMVVGGYLLMTLVYCIPSEAFEKEIKESIVFFEYEKTYPQIIRGYLDSGLDNYTDAIMLLTAADNSNEKNIFVRALECSRLNVSGCNPVESLISIYKTQERQGINTVAYTRYWHGYLVALKPLLVIFNYGEIRYINMFIQGGLFIIVIVLLARRERYEQILFISLIWLFLNPISTVLALQYSWVWIITLVQILFLLLRKGKCVNEKIFVQFLIGGALTSYFDLLTYPIITLGIPLVFYLSMRTITWECKLKQAIEIACFWGIGYSTMWAGKWVLANLIADNTIISNVVKQVLLRTDYTIREKKFSYFDILEEEFKIPNKIYVGIILIVIFCVLYRVIKGISKGGIKRDDYKNVIPYIFVGSFPFIWFAILGNHSFQHSWFTYRTLSVCIYAVLVGGYSMIEKNNSGAMEKKQRNYTLNTEREQNSNIEDILLELSKEKELNASMKKELSRKEKALAEFATICVLNNCKKRDIDMY